MLLSMTGYGAARRDTDVLSVAVEIKSVNNRYLKISTRCPEGYQSMEAEIERVVRRRIMRGAIQLSLRVTAVDPAGRYALCEPVLEHYWQQWKRISGTSDADGACPEAILQLPGVITEGCGAESDPEQNTSVIREVLQEALEKLTAFRATEGQAMQSDLRQQVDTITGQVDEVASQAPRVVEIFRDRLHSRVGELLAETDAIVDSADLIREVSIYAERCDINEELTRLGAHLDQFRSVLEGDTSQGRRLEFVGQEMFREVNTIGSKANDVKISHCVVEMKAAIEKTREILQNVE